MENQLQFYTIDMLIARLVHSRRRYTRQWLLLLAVILKSISLLMLWTSAETAAATCLLYSTALLTKTDTSLMVTSCFAMGIEQLSQEYPKLEIRASDGNVK